MKDILIGRIADIVEPETICLDVQIVSGHAGTYRSREQVRLNRLERRSQLGTMNRVHSIGELVRGNGIVCLIYGRDVRGEIEADVYLLGG